VGGNKTKPIDVRVVAATNRNLREEVEKGRFREDLYYRLAVVELALPPLRERMEDLIPLAEHLLSRSPHNDGVNQISPEVCQIFQSYHWPGNVRELNNVVERAIPFSDGSEITIDALPEALRSGHTGHQPKVTLPADISSPSELPFKDAKDQLIEAFERKYLIDLIDRHGGNVSRAARAADMDRKSITRLMKKHGITRGR
jgi:DNA-binding NtrC family response regulator